MRAVTKHIGDPAALANCPVVGLLQDRAGFSSYHGVQEPRTTVLVTYTGGGGDILLTLPWTSFAKVCKICSQNMKYFYMKSY